MITDEEIVRLVREAIDAREKFHVLPEGYSIDQYLVASAAMVDSEDEVVAVIRGKTAYEVSLNHN